MIPKVIHYCWFGGKPLPESALKCIASWRRFLPDYEIKEWNESNFDINAIPYTSEAYSAKKYAFVSDYARFKILYENGGLYFDTDVEVIKTIDDIIERGPFMGFEVDADKENKGVNPGLGLAATSNMKIYKDIIDSYTARHFINADGSFNETTIVKYTTDILIRHGLDNCPGIQIIDGINIYPAEYFNPLDSNTGKLRKTHNTRTIHWYAKTWYSESRLRTFISRTLHRIFGVRLTSALHNFLSGK